MNTVKENGKIFEDGKVSVKIKLSAIWAAMLFLFAYGDIFSYFRTGMIEGILKGTVGGMSINQGFLMFTTAYITIPCFMVILSLVLKAGVNRWVNIITASVYALSIIGFCIGETWLYYIFLSVLECGLLLAAVWHAWKWPVMNAK